VRLEPCFGVMPSPHRLWPEEPRDDAGFVRAGGTFTQFGLRGLTNQG
jgi:hypothetical protein